MISRKGDIRSLRKLYEFLLEQDVGKILFTDEKVFSIARHSECRREMRQLVAPVFVGVRYKPTHLSTRKYFSVSKYLIEMSFTKAGNHFLYFSPSCRVVKLLPRCPPLSGNEMVQTLMSIQGEVMETNPSLILQHDRAPWYTAKITQKFVQQSFPRFIPFDLWPVPSRLYNPLDYWLFPLVQRELARNDNLRDNRELFEFVSKAIFAIPNHVVKANNEKLLNKLSSAILTKLSSKTKPVSSSTKDQSHVTTEVRMLEQKTAS